MKHIASVHFPVKGRLVRIDLVDRPPRVIGAFRVIRKIDITILAIPSHDLLYVLVRDPVELKEELPSLHVRLHQL